MRKANGELYKTSKYTKNNPLGIIQKGVRLSGVEALSKQKAFDSAQHNIDFRK